MSMTQGQRKLLAAFSASRKKKGLTRKEAVEAAGIKGTGTGPMVKGLMGSGYIATTYLDNEEYHYKATPEGRKALRSKTK